MHEETKFAERNQHLLQMALSTVSIDIHQKIFVRMGGWDKQKTNHQSTEVTKGVVWSLF